jgi:hypothetical protein
MRCNQVFNNCIIRKLRTQSWERLRRTAAAPTMSARCACARARARQATGPGRFRGARLRRARYSAARRRRRRVLDMLALYTCISAYYALARCIPLGVRASVLSWMFVERATSER